MQQRRVVRSFVVSSMFAAACGGGGGGKGAAMPAPALAAPQAVCAAGLHASGVTGRATSWDAVAMLASTSADAMCEASPCGDGEAVSFVGTAPDDVIAVKHDGGWTVIGAVWDSDEGVPQATVTMLGDARWLHLYFEELGRDDVELDDGTQTTATVVVGQTYQDFVLGADGKVLFRAVCGGEGDDHRPTVIARDGDTFAYTRCEGDATPVRFTAATAAECPSYVEGTR